LDKDKAYLVALPFKKKGKNSLKLSDFIFTLSLDMKWGPPDKVRALISEAASEGLVRVEGEIVHASFEAGAVDIPVGFKPAQVDSILEQGIKLILSKTGMTRREIVALINERQDALERLVDLDAVVLLVAREMGIDVSEQARAAYEKHIAGPEEPSA
jgi:hypothetical protein